MRLPDRLAGSNRAPPADGPADPAEVVARRNSSRRSTATVEDPPRGQARRAHRALPVRRRPPGRACCRRALRDPPRAVVECNESALSARYGPFLVTTPWRNVRAASVSGPYRWFRAIGPRLSLSDRGVTFGTATAAGRLRRASTGRSPGCSAAARCTPA